MTNFVINSLGQPVGLPLSDLKPALFPPHEPMTGRLCRLEPLDNTHAPALYQAFGNDADGRNWTYLPYGPFESYDSFSEWLNKQTALKDPQFYTVFTDKGAVGIASYLRIFPELWTIEVGHIHFSPLLQRTAAGTEAMYLMMRRAFELNYRRYEWKCNALNELSRKAAERLGFTFEGIFRQAMVTKNRNRDTAWYSVTDGEWCHVCQAFEQWLAPENTDKNGGQIRRLQDIRADMITH